MEFLVGIAIIAVVSLLQWRSKRNEARDTANRVKPRVHGIPRSEPTAERDVNDPSP